MLGFIALIVFASIVAYIFLGDPDELGVEYSWKGFFKGYFKWLLSFVSGRGKTPPTE